MHDVPPNYPPNYDQWFRKPCWYIKEICYLAQGIHPDCMPGGTIFEFDEENGEVESRPVPVNNEALVIAIEFFKLISRAIDSGELKPAVLGGECFKPNDAVDYLNQKSVSLPRGIVLPHELLITKPGLAEETEAIGGSIAQPSQENVGQEIYVLFDPMSQKAIKALFDRVEADKWKEYFYRAARNGLKDAREGETKPYQYNPARVADWLIDKGHYILEYARRKLANNLPERSKDKKHIITGKLE